MRLTTGISSGKAAFYDRNPLQVIQADSSTLVPQALANRWSYTVPAARKAIVESTVNGVERQVAATTAQTHGSWIVLTKSGGGNQNTMVARIQTNNVGDKDSLAGFGVGTLLAGDSIAGAYSDASTAGSVLQTVSAKITEYDA